MFAVTKRDLVAECSGRVGTDQINSSESSGCGWLRRPAGMVAAAVLFLLCLGAGQPAQAQTFTSVHSFNWTDGAQPYDGLIMDSSGNLYGTTYYGGTASQGTVFKLDPSGTETVIHSFSGTDGADPRAGLIMDSSGNIYGTTAGGGSLSAGTVFKIDSSGNFSVLYNFNPTNGTDGADPYGGLVMDSTGNLYGTTQAGGTSPGYGTVFKIDTNNNENVLHSFTLADGAFPYAGLVRDSTGNLYGTTTSGGTGGYGAVFKIDPAGNYSPLYNFTGGGDGEHPYGGLTMDSSGNLYGTTFQGGSASVGTVFKIDPSGQETVIHNFTGSDGSYPYDGLILDSSGNLYGTTTSGGTTISGGLAYYGTAFKIALSVPFASFSVKLSTTAGPPPGFNLNALCTQGAGAPAIDPVAQGMTLTVGTYTVTIPPGSFAVTKKGWFVYNGTINGVSLGVRISQTGTNSYQVQVAGSGVDLTTLANPVTVTLTLGSNYGTTQISL